MRRLSRDRHHRHNRKRQRDQRDNLDNLVRRNAESAVVIRLARCVAVDNLHQARHEHKSDAHHPEQG